MAKKSNYVFPIERNTALEVVKIVKNFYLLEGATGEELLAKRSGLSTRLLLDGINDNVITQDLLNNIYANLNNEEELISIVKEKFQSIDYESALFLLRWTKDSQSPYYPRGMGEKPVEQFNEDYELSKDLLIAYINDHGIIAIKNLPGRVIRVQREIVKDMANGYRSTAIDEARKILTANQEALSELRTSIKEQKQKIADLKAADENAETSELEAKLKDDRYKAMEQYKVVKGQRRSLRDTLEERAILERDFADVVGGRMISKAQFDAEREEDDEKFDLVKKVFDIVKRTPDKLPNPQQALAIITLNVKGKYNDREVKELLGEPIDDNSGYTPQDVEINDAINNEAINTDIIDTNETVTNITNDNMDNTITEKTTGDTTTDTTITDNGITPNDTAVQNTAVYDGTAQDNNSVQYNIATQETTTQIATDTPPVNINPTPVNANSQMINNEQYVNNTVAGNIIPNTIASPTANEQPINQVSNGTASTDTSNNGQDIFNSIYNSSLEETNTQEQATNNVQPQQSNQVNTNPTDPNNANV